MEEMMENTAVEETAAGEVTVEEALTAAQAENETLRATCEQLRAESARLSRTHAIELALRDGGARNCRAVRALLDEDAIALSEDGTLAGLTEQLDALRASDPYLFADGEVRFVGTAPAEGADELPAGEMTYSQFVRSRRG